MSRQCSVRGCTKAAATSLHAQAFCREHFIAICYVQIEECAQQLVAREHLRETSARGMGGELTEITDEAARLGLSADDLTNLERAQVMDILLSAAHLSGRLRRSPRRRGSIPVRLRYEGPGHTWEEETVTYKLSRHGALLICRHAAEPGEELTLVRIDTGQQARVRVAWRGPRREGSQELGIEILGIANFWEAEW